MSVISSDGVRLSGPVSVSAFARGLGVTRQAVYAAIRSGRITQREDGRIDFEQGVRDWHQNRRGPPPRGAAMTSPTDVLLETSSDLSVSRLQQVELALKVEERKVRLEAAKGKLIDRAKARLLVRKLAQEERDAILNWPARVASVLASELGVDAHRLQLLLDKHLRAHLAARAELDVEL